MKQEYYSADRPEPVCDSLTRLHDGAWWTSVVLRCPDHPNNPNNPNPTQFRVELCRTDGSPLFPAASERCTWSQRLQETRMLPWPIPATLAADTGAHLRLICEDPNLRCRLQITCFFQDCPRLWTNDRWLFVSDDGGIQHMWEGQRHTEDWPGSPQTKIQYHRLYSLVPTMERLLDRPWDDKQVFCCHGWNERFVEPARQC